MLLADLPLAALKDVALGLIFVLFVLSAVLLTVVILLQEGKGGGLGSAFGGAAADAFGVKAGTVNRFTAYLAASFLGLALLYLGLSAGGDQIRMGGGGRGGIESGIGDGQEPPGGETVEDESGSPGGEPASPGEGDAPGGDEPGSEEASPDSDG